MKNPKLCFYEDTACVSIWQHLKKCALYIIFTHTYRNTYTLSKFSWGSLLEVMDSKCSWLCNSLVRNMYIFQSYLNTLLHICRQSLLTITKEWKKRNRSQSNCKHHWAGPLLKKFKLQSRVEKLQSPEKQPLCQVKVNNHKCNLSLLWLWGSAQAHSIHPVPSPCS